MERPLNSSIKSWKFCTKTRSIKSSSICTNGTCIWLSCKEPLHKVFSKDSNNPSTHLITMRLSNKKLRIFSKDNTLLLHTFLLQKRLTSTWVCQLSSLRALCAFLNQKINPEWATTTTTITYSFNKAIEASIISMKNITVTIILLAFQLKSLSWPRVILNLFLILFNQQTRFKKR